MFSGCNAETIGTNVRFQGRNRAFYCNFKAPKIRVGYSKQYQDFRSKESFLATQYSLIIKINYRQ